MEIKQLTINRLQHHSFKEFYEKFLSIYNKLFLDDELSEEDVSKILSIVVLFSNQSDLKIRQLGYRMALAYGNKTKDFTPLYDISINSGLIPIVSLIIRITDLPIYYGRRKEDSFLSTMIDSYIDNFRDEEKTLTESQYRLNSFFKENLESSITIIAPTSYGKSDLIIATIRESEEKRICILVPSKALLAQTRKRVLNAKIAWVKKIIMHPEMHNPDDISSVYILTQERLTRVLNHDKDLYFDIVIVDEAHNLLDKDSRNTLLASVIRVLDFRNKNTAFKFLTPFLKEPSSLKIREVQYQSSDFKINEYVKSELLYIADYRNGNALWEFYDHFTDQYTELENESDNHISYIHDNSSTKNIIYFNRPKHIQEFAKNIAGSFPEIHSKIIDKAAKEIKANTHEHYLLLHCMKHGVLYHHGSMTDPIRNYVEFLYATCDDIRYLISSSTLLEGVNLPIEKMFLLSISKGRGNLTPSQFKNLIGRINRFGEIFNAPDIKSLQKLQPEIHIIATDRYVRKGANLHNFIEKVMKVTKKEKDIVSNVLLEGTEIDESNEDEYTKAINRLGNLESGIIEGVDCPIVITEVGLKLLENNIAEINAFDAEQEINNVLEIFRKEEKLIEDSNTLMKLIGDAFVSFINPDNTRERNSLKRLKNEKAQTFYAMFLDWRIENTPLPIMVQRFVNFWEKLPHNTPVYVGSWGDIEIGAEAHGELFTFIEGKTIAEKINLAIVRIKEEDDFFDYVIFRFIEILNELEFLDEAFYKLAKYGTTDSRVIKLIKNGFSRSVGELLLRDYSDLIEFHDDDVFIDPTIHKRFEEDKIGFFQKYEVLLNVAQE